jgi:hypothetical protein
MDIGSIKTSSTSSLGFGYEECPKKWWILSAIGVILSLFLKKQKAQSPRNYLAHSVITTRGAESPTPPLNLFTSF